jgi:hypothetical protein
MHLNANLCAEEKCVYLISNYDTLIHNYKYEHNQRNDLTCAILRTVETIKEEDEDPRKASGSGHGEAINGV